MFVDRIPADFDCIDCMPGATGTQEKVDELQVELDSTKLDMEHAQLSAKENEAAARALRYCASRAYRFRMGFDKRSARGVLA